MKVSEVLFCMATRTLSSMFASLALLLFSAFAYGAFQIPINGPAGSGEFGRQVVILMNGNLVIVDPGYDAPGPIPDVGAAYLYNGATGELISTLTGSSSGDFAETRVVALPNSDYVVINRSWDNESAIDAGAVTHCSGVSGCSGMISNTNSLVGTSSNDNVGSGGVGAVVLTNGNYVISSPRWKSGDAERAGAVTWANGETGITGPVTPDNSLIGSASNDQLGSPVPIALPNGNYMVKDVGWNNGRGAVTVGNGNGGSVGPLTPSNSLVGGNDGDSIGAEFLILPNSNFVIMSSSWNSQRGAVTLCFGDGSTIGEVSAANSMVGADPNDSIGSGRGIALTNGNYVTRSIFWNGERGAVTWGSGIVPTVGVVSDANSLVGSIPGDRIGLRGVFALTNGNYVINSPEWNNGGTNNAGAVTWGNGTAGTSGIVSPSNSLVGSTADDQIGVRDTLALANGNYVATSQFWDNGTIVDAGAVTWGNGNGGTVGPVSPANSLVGTSEGDGVGGSIGGLGVRVLTNGNYVVETSGWNDVVNSRVNAGAVTWADGNTGVVGPITELNSVIGASADDRVGSGSIYPLPNGNFVFASPFWNNGALEDVGAVTFVNGLTGLAGNISTGNSLIGDTAFLRLGTTDTFVLTNGNYVVRSTRWNNFTGAVAFGNGTTGTVGVISPANSLVGSNPDDLIGSSGIFALPNGNYVVSSNSWNNDRGAVTWGNGASGTIGTVSSNNSLIGGAPGDNVGPSQPNIGPDGNYILSVEFVNGGLGGFSFGAGNGGANGIVDSSNTVFKSVADSPPPVSRANVNGTFGNMVVALPLENRVTIFNPTYIAVENGNWSNGLTWNYGEIRTRVDTRIPAGRIVTLDTDVISNLVFVETDALLNVAGQRSSDADLAIAGTIDISQGGLNMQSNMLALDCNAALVGVGPSHYVIGPTRKLFCGPGAFRFPTGTDNGFSPLDVNVTSSGINASLTVSATQTVHPALMPAHSLKRYWRITEVNGITADIVFNYLDPIDISGSESTYKLFRVNNGIPEIASPFVLDTDANTVSKTGVTQFSDWAIGNLAPTSALASVGGRVVTQNGRGIANAIVSVSDMNGNVRYTRPNNFGFYRFDGLLAGETYIFDVQAKGYTFSPQVVTVMDKLKDLDLIAAG